MKKFALLVCAAIAGTTLAPSAQAAGTPRSQMKPFFTTLPARGVDTASLQFQAAAGATIPFFTNTVTSPLDHTTYQFSIVGADPTKAKVTTHVQYVPIALRVHFSDGTVLDPSKPGCNDTVSVSQRFFQSPLFQNQSQTSNGVLVGNTQVIDAFQRAEFWKYVKGTNYHTLLVTSLQPRLLDVTAPSGSVTSPGACAGTAHNLGQIDINAYDSILQGIANKYATTAQIPVIMSYNVVQTSGGCCIIGYHSAYGRSTGTQVYATGAYTDFGIFSGISDIHAWSHELGELFNDPFVNNATPAWGHVGQVSGCQNNFETGDPLTGTPYLLVHNGFTYHPQEQAFFDWFYRTPASGTGGEYSFEGKFETAQGACV
ncbi:MAG: hypothetical protein M3R53_06195 [Candidatus Eremiobacteraeota bacterium]|nr:hypothetical protein [Candidatus Eremiobacteraeota bacterium]